MKIKTLTNDDFNEYKRLVSTVKEEFTQDSHYSQTMTDTLIHDILDETLPTCIVFCCYDRNTPRCYGYARTNSICRKRAQIIN